MAALKKYNSMHQIVRAYRTKAEIVVEETVAPDDPESKVSKPKPDIIDFNYNAPRASTLVLMAKTDSDIKMLEKKLILAFFSDGLAKLVKTDAQSVWELAKVVLQGEHAMMEDSYDLAEVPEWAIQVYEYYVSFSKVIMLGTDPVAQAFASEWEIDHQDYERFFNGRYWAEGTRQQPYYFRDLAASMKQDPRILKRTWKNTK